MDSQKELENTIASIWKEVLKVDSVGVRDNFFDLGGTSALLSEVHKKLRDAVAAELPLLELFKLPTIALLARHLAGKGAERRNPDGSKSSAPASRKSQVEWQRRARLDARDAGSKGDGER
jgi:acyl carrier protein